MNLGRWKTASPPEKRPQCEPFKEIRPPGDPSEPHSSFRAGDAYGRFRLSLVTASTRSSPAAARRHGKVSSPPMIRRIFTFLSPSATYVRTRTCVACLPFAFGGCAGTRPLPGPAVEQKRAAIQATATRVEEVPDLSTDPSFAVGVTHSSPERVAEAVRSRCEPAYGTMKCVTTELPNGNSKRVLLTPRFGVSNSGMDYRWIEVTITFEAARRRSLVEVVQVSRTWRLFRFSAHGGLWPFPGSIDGSGAGAAEHALLRAIMGGLNDAAVRISEWGKMTVDE
jgi:hypothetical protein